MSVAREADDVESLAGPLGKRERVDRALEPLPDDVELALEGGAPVADQVRPEDAADRAERGDRTPPDEDLREHRFDRDGAGPHRSVVGRHLAPPD